MPLTTSASYKGTAHLVNHIKVKNNIILLTCDCLRADHLSSYGYERTTTPEIDEFAEDNIRFTNAYSVSSHTREAVAGFLTGKYPDEAIDEGYNLIGTPISERLKQQGFKTGAFHSNPYLSRAYGYSRGFDKFDDDLYLGQNKFIALAQRLINKIRNRHYASAEEINKRSFNWLDSLNYDKPFFVWNHYMDPHGPYQPPDSYKTRFTDKSVSDKRAQSLYDQSTSEAGKISEEEHRILIDLYDAEIRYTDHHIGRFLGGLKRRELLRDSLVIITADHGDAFGEHGYYSHPRRLHKELTHIPMIISTPGADASIIKEPISSLSIAETVVPGSGESEINSLLPVSDLESNGLVFSQARSDTKDNIRYFSSQNGEEQCIVKYDLEKEEVVSTDGSRSQRQPVIEHITSRSSSVNESKNGTSGNAEIDRRLSALGYK